MRLLRWLIFGHEQNTAGFPGSTCKIIIIDQGLVLVPSHVFATSWKLTLESHICFFVVLTEWCWGMLHIYAKNQWFIWGSITWVLDLRWTLKYKDSASFMLLSSAGAVGTWSCSQLELPFTVLRRSQGLACREYMGMHGLLPLSPQLQVHNLLLSCSTPKLSLCCLSEIKNIQYSYAMKTHLMICRCLHVSSFMSSIYPLASEEAEGGCHLASSLVLSFPAYLGPGISKVWC